jgi:hypothetical protein
VTVWSTMRLLTTRGWESTTRPFFCAYDVGPGAPSGAPFSAGPNVAVVSRGMTRCAAPKCVWSATPLLDDPSTVRRPYGSSGLAIWFGPVPNSGRPGTGAPFGPSLVACASAILICLRMNRRSPAFRVNPWPTGAAAALRCTASWTARPSTRVSVAAAHVRNLLMTLLRSSAAFEYRGSGGAGWRRPS